jgi:hypothetical protein
VNLPPKSVPVPPLQKLLTSWYRYLIYDPPVATLARYNEQNLAPIIYTLADDSGLDKNDVLLHNIEGFKARYVLQHYRYYHPFVTEIVIERDFTGTVQ